MGVSESKTNFKQDVFKLAGDNIPATDPWWARFYQLPESAEDVFALWSPNDVRSLTLNSAADRPPPGTQSSPKNNLETLIYTCVSRLQMLQTRRVYPDPQQSIAPEVLNCVRVLTRLMPYIYEAEHLAAWEESFFWRTRRPQRIPSSHPTSPGSAAGELFDGLNPARTLAEESNLGEPLGELLLDILVRYLFFPGFTLPKRLDEAGLPELKVQYHIWNSGIGCRQSVGMTKENERNAAEVLRLLLALCSKQCYLPPQIVAEVDARVLTYLTTQLERQVALSMICSLLNTVLKYNPAIWRVPVDMSLGADAKSHLVTLSLQLLDILLLYSAPNGEANAFRKALSRLHRAEDFQFIQQGIALVLTQPVSGMSSYLPGSQRMVSWTPEMLILFWELLQANKRFRSFIIDTDRAHDLTVLVLYYAMDAKDDPSKQGFMRMCVLILQTLSVEPSFGARLNKTFVGQESLPQVLRIANFHGSYADFLITSIHKLMTTTQGRLESIYPALLAIINNIAPHMRDLGRATSSMLVDLFVSVSSPSFLLEKEGNHAMLFSLLEAINAILEHQFEANRRFVEVIVRSRKRFQALREFTIEGALAEIDRQAQERKDHAAGTSDAASRIRGPGRSGTIDNLRSPSEPTRSPQLRDVPEDGAFAIGGDEDDGDVDHDAASDRNGAESSRSSISQPLDTSLEEAVPLQSPSMSEKARGKQPVGQGSFSRSTSRNASTTSLTTYNLISPSASTAGMQQVFTPTAEWLEEWLPHLPLHTILTTINHGSHAYTSQETAATGLKHARIPIEKHAPAVKAEELVPSRDSNLKVQAFQWTSLSLGWYLSMLWGYTYAQDEAQNRGMNGIWTGTAIRLFGVKSPSTAITLRSPKGAVDAVGNSIVQRLGSLSFKSAPTTREV